MHPVQILKATQFIGTVLYSITNYEGWIESFWRSERSSTLWAHAQKTAATYSEAARTALGTALEPCRIIVFAPHPRVLWSQPGRSLGHPAPLP